MTTEFVLRDRWLREKFERQTRPLLAALHRAARRLSVQPADAEDLVHDTYVKAFQAFPTVELRDDAACRAWLLRIMTNTYRDRYRREARSPEVAGSVDLDRLDGAAPSREPGPDRRLESKCFFIEQLSYREIGEIAQCPTGTVMSRLWRGRRFLRQALRAYCEHEPREPLDDAVSAGGRHGP